MALNRRDVLAVTGLGLVGGGLGGAFLGDASASAASVRIPSDGYGTLTPAGKELALS